MISALNHGPTGVQKLIFLPGQVYIQMRTAVAVNKQLAVFFNGEEFFAVMIEASASAFGNLVSVQVGGKGAHLSEGLVKLA